MVFCNDIMEAVCDQADTSHGVNNDSYSVYVLADEYPNDTLEHWDAQTGDCGGRPNRQVSEIVVDGVVGVKITCTYSYNAQSARTLYLVRRDGVIYSINASNQTNRPVFEEPFLASFHFT